MMMVGALRGTASRRLAAIGLGGVLLVGLAGINPALAASPGNG
jgi:hypothetical protein